MKNKTITVAIPAYNAEEFILDTINSVLIQSHSVNEIIVCDDSSKDDTVEIVRKIIKLEKHNIKLLINRDNLGYQKNWNKCLENASSDFALLLHADDLLKPDTIDKQLQFFQEHPEVALVGGYEDFIDEKGNLKRENEPKETNIYNTGQIFEFVTNHNSYIACSSVLFNMEKINQVGFFNENILGTDELYWPRVLTKFPIAVLGESLINRRIHQEQTEYKDFVENYKKVIGAYPEFQKIIQYESRSQMKLKLKLYFKKKFSLSALSIARIVMLHSRKLWLSFLYIVAAIKIDFKIFKSKKLYKTIMVTILHYFNIKKIRK
jgi:glycosyltransferase involved in cell wall biosynthesis